MCVTGGHVTVWNLEHDSADSDALLLGDQTQVMPSARCERSIGCTISAHVGTGDCDLVPTPTATPEGWDERLRHTQPAPAFPASFQHTVTTLGTVKVSI